MVLYLESAIDEFETELVPISFFILPGGSVESSFLHISRSITRRAETAVVTLSKSQRINFLILIYLNRLSDLLFTMARFVNHVENQKETIWKKQ